MERFAESIRPSSLTTDNDASNRFPVSREFQILRFVQPKQMFLEIDFHVAVGAAVLVNIVCEKLNFLEDFVPERYPNHKHFDAGRKAFVCHTIIAIDAFQYRFHVA